MTQTTLDPHNYGVIDVETTNIKAGETPRTKFWGIADCRGYKRFETTKDLLKFLRSYKERVWLHHTNFDVIQLLVDGAKLRIARSHNGRIIRSQLGKHTLVNSYSCFPTSLAGIFWQFGYQKHDLAHLDERNYGDCVVGLKCLLALDDMFRNLCGVSPLAKGTIAGTSFAAAVNAAGRKMPIDLRFLQAYRGGRVEVFSTKEFPLANKYDINSSYPFSILDCPEQAELWKVKVKTTDFYCPLFDMRNEELLLFPNGTFTSYVFRDVWERYIEPHATHTSIKVMSKHILDFAWLASLKGFVRDLYFQKQHSTGAKQYCLKLLLNSLYGRMGMKGESERARIMEYRPDGEEVSAFRLGRSRWLIFDTVRRDCPSNYGFAAYITDNARGRLYSGFVKADAIYGDTDSIVTLQDNFSLPISSECGDWKYEGRESFRALNVKDYCWGADEVRKGGEDFTLWTLKQFAKSGVAADIHRERITELRKRHVLESGDTVPLNVSR